MLTVERILTSTSEKELYFDASEMLPPSANTKDARAPNDDITGVKERSGYYHPDVKNTDRSSSMESLAVAGSREDHTPPFGGMGSGRGTSFARKGSTRTTKSTRSATEATAAFQNGSALAGPNAEPEVDEDIIRRGAIAERSLSTRQKYKIQKDEQQDAKRLSKFLKTESDLEKAALVRALKSLAALQDLHKTACKREEKVEAAQYKSTLAAQKAESTYHEARARAEEERARWKGKIAEAKAQEKRLQAEREAVREVEERVAECAREVERLRIIKATDEREREAKKAELLGKKN